MVHKVDRADGVGKKIKNTDGDEAPIKAVALVVGA